MEFEYIIKSIFLRRDVGDSQKLPSLRKRLLFFVQQPGLAVSLLRQIHQKGIRAKSWKKEDADQVIQGYESNTALWENKIKELAPLGANL